MRYILLLALISGPALGQVDCAQGMAPLLQVAKACVVQDSRKLVKSNENAESIATASLVNCASMIRPVKDDYDRCYDPDVAARLKPAFERALREIAIAEVVNTKASR